MLRIEFIKVTEAGTFLDIIDYRTVMLQDELSNCIVYVYAREIAYYLSTVEIINF